MDAKPLTHDTLKGKVDIKWYGHCGFKIGFKDDKDVQRAVYIDIWIDGKDCPEEEKKNPRTTVIWPWLRTVKWITACMHHSS
jgi:hypothetical protein